MISLVADDTPKSGDPGSGTVDGRRKSRALSYIVAVTFFMEYLDTTIIATALPQMARSFSVGPNEVSLGMSAYMLTLAVFIPVSGWFADRFGSRTVFAGALVIFLIASVLCGLASDVGAFTAARVLQGLGGAMMVPVGRMIVVRNTDKSQMMTAISTITWPAVIAPVLGPTVGGFITTYASWHWVFFINVPFGIAALIAILYLVPNQRGESRSRLDLAGFALSGLALASLLYGAELASHEGASLFGALAFLIAGFLLGLFAVAHLRRTREPLLQLSILQYPTYAVTVLWGSATRIGMETAPYLLPLLFQIGFGLTPFEAGLLLLASACGNLGMKLFTTPILKRFGFRTVAACNGLMAALLLFACGWLTPSTPLALTALILFGYGLTRSLQFTTLGTLAYADVNDAEKAPASTLFSVAHQMTIGMGIAFAAVSLRASASLTHANAGGAFAIQDFRWAFAIAALLVLISLLGYVRLPKDSGRSLGGGASAPLGSSQGELGRPVSGANKSK